MRYIHALVEGQTEETFIRDVLLPYFKEKNIWLTPILLKTKRTQTGVHYRGGVISYKKFKSDLLRLLSDTNSFAVTTMIDYYGIPDDYPGKKDIRGIHSIDRCHFLEESLKKDINNQKFIPFLCLHEFESLLFASPKHISEAFPENAGLIYKKISDIGDSFKNPEEINEGHQTHPSARILEIIRGYKKPLHGPLIIKRIGLDIIRTQCPHFHEWIQSLETIVN